MKYIILLVVVFVFETTYSQKNYSKQISKANTYSKTGNQQQAVLLWKKIEKNADKYSASYGKVIRNLLYHYSQVLDESNLINYYNKVMLFNLNNIEKKEDIGKSFLNTKYHSTLLMASFYKNKSNYSKALYYVNKADESILYHTNSISNFSGQKIDLAMWRYWIYTDLDKKDLALSALVKRAFEYNYKAMYSNWHFDSGNRKELELSQMIGTVVEDLDSFSKEIDNAIESLNYDKRLNLILLSIRGVKYKIETNQILDVSRSKEYLKDSPFYQFIKTQNRGVAAN